MRTTRRKVSYVVNLCNEEQTHCLGVNSVALDTSTNGVLYSAGRDGIVAGWDLNMVLNQEGKLDREANVPKTTCKAFSQMHTDWVNDIVLCEQGTCVVSASSDRTIKLWKPSSKTTHTIGYHTDYAKCLAYASEPGWVASGGLDRRIAIWDIEQSVATVTIDAGPHQLDGSSESTNVLHSTASKCSIYALAVNSSGTLLVSGSPEKVVRLWDPRSGKRVSKLTGHTDNIRTLLISDDGNYVLSGSSDSTIKLWSVKAQRCLNTYETHPDSVWSLCSNDPNLKTFYSGSRDGLVNRTHISGRASDDAESECIALFKEESGVTKLAVLDDTYIWTATSSSSINRWLSVPDKESRQVLPRSDFNTDIPPTSLIKIPSVKGAYAANTDSFIASDSLTMYAGSVLSIPISYQDEETDNDETLIPLRASPDSIIPGKPGITSHLVLHNRRHVLTKDTNGAITMWDLARCIQIENFGKQDLEDVAQKVNTMESFPAWCSVDTKIGAITVQLHEFNCFDCEMYADEVELPAGYTIKEDQRLNLGKWVIFHLFDKFTQHELKLEQGGGEPRFSLNELNKPESTKSKDDHQPQRPLTEKRPTVPNISIPVIPEGPKMPSVALTTDGPQSPFAPTSPTGPYTAPPTTTASSVDYFSGSHHMTNRRESTVQAPPTAALPTSPTSPTSSNFMNRLKSLSVKAKLVRVPTNEEGGGGEVEDEDEDDDRQVESQLSTARDETLASKPSNSDSNEMYSPAHFHDFPPLEIPSSTMIIIAEESAEASTGMDLYRGTVESAGEDADNIIDVAPTWLLSYLLYNKTPVKETVKLTFVLRPAADTKLEELPGGPNNRLLANRVLRVRKLIQYVAEKLHIQDISTIELLCNDTVLTCTMTLATIKQHILKSSGDIPLCYRLKSEVNESAGQN
ncbi:WD40 repeat-like protein [Backusella circina FSU 941]|nr:WD40 repeat-like protein [Backusella circina FSU 941]